MRDISVRDWLRRLWLFGGRPAAGSTAAPGPGGAVLLLFWSAGGALAAWIWMGTDTRQKMVSLTLLLGFLLPSGPESGAIFFTCVMVAVSVKACSERALCPQGGGGWKAEDGPLGYLSLQFWSVAGKLLSSVFLCKSPWGHLFWLPSWSPGDGGGQGLARCPRGGARKALSSDEEEGGGGSDTVTLGSSALRMCRILSASVRELPEVLAEMWRTRGSSKGMYWTTPGGCGL